MSTLSEQTLSPPSHSAQIVSAQSQVAQPKSAQSQSSQSLCASILDTLTQAFGQPQRRGDDYHWSLSPGGILATINVLFHYRHSQPTVWVFDPHDGKQGALDHRIEASAHADRLVRDIQVRLMNAGNRQGLSVRAG